MGSSVYNIETRVGKDGKAYIMELSPRGGGNRLSEMLKYATGVNLIKNAVRAAVGMNDFDVEQRPYKGHWAEIILHAPKDGTFIGVDINQDFYSKYVTQTDLWVKRGDKLYAFNGANDAIGTLVLNFDTDEELSSYMKSQDTWLNVVVK
jgi:biotin carboxylase